MGWTGRGGVAQGVRQSASFAWRWVIQNAARRFERPGRPERTSRIMVDVGGGAVLKGRTRVSEVRPLLRG